MIYSVTVKSSFHSALSLDCIIIGYRCHHENTLLLLYNKVLYCWCPSRILVVRFKSGCKFIFDHAFYFTFQMLSDALSVFFFNSAYDDPSGRRPWSIRTKPSWQKNSFSTTAAGLLNRDHHIPCNTDTQPAVPHHLSPGSDIIMDCWMSTMHICTDVCTTPS